MKTQILFFIAFVFTAANSFAQNIDQQFFDKANAFFQKNVENGLVPYADLKNDGQLASLIDQVENAQLTNASDATKKAFFINAYNLQVIKAASDLYPINSVQTGGGFFDRMKVKVAGINLTLNKLEKQFLLAPYKDARLHFVLVCGALGCPPITNFAYRPELLDQQLDQQTRLAINDPNFIKVNGQEAALSQIFQWYASDFGGNKKAVLSFINKYRSTPITPSAKITYYDYDWSLNNASATSSDAFEDTPSSANNASRYVVSSAIPKGSIEVKIFNNLYTQRTGSEGNLTDRSTFLTSTMSFLYGITNHFNLGFNTRYRRVRNDRLPSSALDVLGSGEAGSSRQGLTAFGPQIRYAPVKAWQNFSIQSSFVFPIGEDLAGNSSQPYIDWNGATWHTQFFNDFSIGNNFSLFTEIDVLWEDIGSQSEGNINRVSTPAILIFSYNPDKKTTIYTLGGFSPFWQDQFDYFVQAGIGVKYQFTPKLELELLYTDFTNKFLNDTGGQAATYNIGFRFNL